MHGEGPIQVAPPAARCALQLSRSLLLITVHSVLAARDPLLLGRGDNETVGKPICELNPGEVRFAEFSQTFESLFPKFRDIQSASGCSDKLKSQLYRRLDRSHVSILESSETCSCLERILSYQNTLDLPYFTFSTFSFINAPDPFSPLPLSLQ